MDVLIATAAERPVAPLLGDFNPWPRFMLRGSRRVAVLRGRRDGPYPEFVLIAIDRDDPDHLVAKGYSVPFTWDDDPAVSLPEEGWDGVILSAALDRFAGRRGNLVSALDILRPCRSEEARDWADPMLAAMRDNAAALGFTSLVAPVRPNRKHLHPDLSIGAYADLRPRRRATRRSLAAGSRARRRDDRRDSGPRDDDSLGRLDRPVARLDGPAVRHHRPGDRAGGS